MQHDCINFSIHYKKLIITEKYKQSKPYTFCGDFCKILWQIIRVQFFQMLKFNYIFLLTVVNPLNSMVDLRVAKEAGEEVVVVVAAAEEEEDGVVVVTVMEDPRVVLDINSLNLNHLEIQIRVSK